MDYVEDIAFLSNNVLEAQGLLDLAKEACNNIGLVLDDKKKEIPNNMLLGRLTYTTFRHGLNQPLEHPSISFPG